MILSNNNKISLYTLLIALVVLMSLLSCDKVTEPTPVRKYNGTYRDIVVRLTSNKGIFKSANYPQYLGTYIETVKKKVGEVYTLSIHCDTTSAERWMVTEDIASGHNRHVISDTGGIFKVRFTVD